MAENGKALPNGLLIRDALSLETITALHEHLADLGYEDHEIESAVRAYLLDQRRQLN